MYPLLMLFVFLSHLSAVLLNGWVFLQMFCQCYVTVTMFRNNILQQCICNLLYACKHAMCSLDFGEIACNKYPVLLLLLLLRREDEYVGKRVMGDGGAGEKKEREIKAEMVG